MRYEFSDCVLDTDAHALFKGGQPQKIEPKVFDLLHLLVRNAGTLVTRDQMIDEVWDGRIVSESAISARIAAARKAVGDDGKSQTIIRTVARRGLQCVAEIKGTTPKPQRTPSPKIRYATADDGVKIAFATSGTGPPLLRAAHHPTHLELEWADGSEREMFDALGAHHTLIRIDQRGSGLSDLDVDDVTTKRSARDMAAVLDTLGFDQVALLGTSSGGMIVAEFAAMFPNRVTHLMTLGGYVEGRAIRDGAQDAPQEEAILTMAKAGWNTPDSAFVAGYLAVYYPDADAEKLQRIARTLQASCPVENEIRGRDFFNRHSIAELLENIQCPTLVMHARGDAVHPLSEGQKFARGIPNAQLMVLETRNHYPLPHEDAWQDMITAMHDFLHTATT